jgi:pyridoxal phosphate enzyme (YggS family)
LKLRWHFIGHIQSNKCRDIAGNFDWIHSIDRYKIARRLSEHRTPEQPTLNLFIQVNLQSEASKAGASPDHAAELAHQITELPNVRLRGLMAIPEISNDFATQRKVFAELRELQEQLITQRLQLDCLSMGMTNDLEAAIAEGATHVRVGTAIFGPRQNKH